MVKLERKMLMHHKIGGHFCISQLVYPTLQRKGLGKEQEFANSRKMVPVVTRRFGPKVQGKFGVVESTGVVGRGKVVTSHQYAFGKSNQLTKPKVSLVSNSTWVDHSFIQSQVIIDDEKVPFKLNFQRLHFFFFFINNPIPLRNSR